MKARVGTSSSFPQPSEITRLLRKLIKVYNSPMTVLDNFIAFARALPTSRREAMEEALAALMESYAERYDLTPDEFAELRRRAAEPDPELSNPDAIAQIFGKTFRA